MPVSASTRDLNTPLPTTVVSVVVGRLSTIVHFLVLTSCTMKNSSTASAGVTNETRSIVAKIFFMSLVPLESTVARRQSFHHEFVPEKQPGEARRGDSCIASQSVMQHVHQEVPT